jgi:hypothetical protein
VEFGIVEADSTATSAGRHNTHGKLRVGFSTLSRVAPINRKTNTSPVTDSEQSIPIARDGRLMAVNLLLL